MKKILIVIIAIIVIVVIAYAITENTSDKEVFDSTVNVQSESPAEVIPTASELAETLTNTFEHPTYNFSFKYPEGYTAKILPGDGEETIVVQNNKAQGFQMRIQEMDEDIRDITPELIRRDLPDLVINDPQEVSLGSSGRGTAFLSDDPAFGGKSREVWFAYNKVFYQITTFAKYDPILQAILGTWKFE